jgi:putative ABC transport system permease protein
VGARRTDIIRQFLIETMLITTTGGLAGIVLGVILSQLVGTLAGWATIVTLMSIALAFFVSVSVGIVAGLYPAVRASNLDPVYALHYE